MGRDPLEGIRPSDSDRPSFTTGAPASPRPTGSPVAPARGGGAKVVIFIVLGACVAFGVAAAVFFQSKASQGPTPRPAATPSPVVTNTQDETSNETDPAIRQVQRHSPDGSPETPPANTMTTIPPKSRP